MKYRSDIDGLRALAVIPVVLFHAGFEVFRGGFVGVDIFFVISGFLITSIILEDLAQNKFSIRHFYERRVRRILPALYIVCFSSLVVATILFLPSELEGFGKSLGATLLFISNILFWSETGYFDASADLKPLLHTWSLAVEEQFYVFFPILLLLISRFLNKKYVPILIMIAIVSFGISIWGVHHKPSATFYWAPTRAWELLIGSLLALNALPSLKSKWQSELLGSLGLLLIGYSVLFFDYDTAFPGLNALYPCLGAALLIYAGKEHETLSGRFLALKPLVFIGLCSYSFYLWHWPVFVFAQYMSFEPLSSMQFALLIILSFVLSVVTWKFIETPCRNREFLQGKWRVFILALFVSIPLFAASGALVISKGLPDRFADIEKLEAYKGSVIDETCSDIKLSEFDNQKCVFGYESAFKNSFVVWGDSHAGALVSGIGEAAETYKKSGYLASFSGCLPLLDVVAVRDENPLKCVHANEAIFENIKAGDTVFLVARWTYYTRKSLINKDGPVWLNDEHSTEISEAENYRVFADALGYTVQAIKDKGAKPVLVSTVPEFLRSVPEAYFLFGKQVTVSKGLMNQNRGKTDMILRDIAEKTDVLYIDPSSAFCDDIRCTGNENEMIYFSDNDHLNLVGAKKAAPLFEAAFQ